MLLLSALQSAQTLAADTLCSAAPVTYSDAKKDYPDLKVALNAIESYGVATWYSDRGVNGDVLKTIETLVELCPESSRLSVVVYALPNKDCAAGYSNGNGTVTTSDDYVAFVTQLARAIGKRKVLYVLEPDAVGLIADGGCAVESGYQDNLKRVIPVLGANPNAEIYLDVGFWTLTKPESAGAVARVVQTLRQAGALKGITLNTSNYRSTEEIAALCTAFQTAIQSTDVHCIVDTSRNYKVPRAAASSEWCNKQSGGIGHPPTSDTGFANLDYFVWIKPAGESDGTCDGKGHTKDAMRGPEAGLFFKSHFVKLWNQGYMVQERKMRALFDPTHLLDGVNSAATATAPNGRLHAVVVLLTAVAIGVQLQ